MGPRRWLLLAVLTMVYVAAGQIGLALAVVHPQASAAWAPTGVAIAAVVLMGARAAPAVLVGATIVNLLVSGDGPTSIAIGIGNTMEALVGGLLVRRFAAGRAAFRTGLGALAFCGFAGGVAPLVSASIGVGALYVAGHAALADLGGIWLTWYLGDAGGALVIGPLILTVADRALHPGRPLETLALIALTTAAGILVFLSPGTADEAALVAFFPLLAWAALRLGPLDTAAATALLGVLAVAGSVTGSGPFAAPANGDALVLLQVFLILSAAVALPVAGLGFHQRALARSTPLAHVTRLPTGAIGALTFVPLVAATLAMAVLARDGAVGRDSLVPWLILALGGLASLVITALNVTSAATGARALSLAQEMTAQLAARERQFHALVEGAPDALVIVDATGTIRMINEQTTILFGHTADQLVGQPAEVLIPRRYHAAYPAQRDAYLRAPRRRPIGVGQTLWGLHRDGRELPVEISLAPIQTDAGLLVAASVRDVTMQREAHRRLGRALEDLQRSNRELEEFAYVASHDLQAPLRHVSSYAQLLQEHADQLDPEARGHLERIGAAVARMRAMIQDLLVYSRAGRGGVERQEVDLGAVVADIVEALRSELAEAGGDVRWSDLPAVEADPAQIRQVLDNLIQNAVKYRGQRPPEIEIAAADRGAEWEIAVHDNGPGFDPDQCERIFQMFQRLPQAIGVPGTGIGLAICRKVVEGHGGRIWAETEPGRGSTFRLTLPKAHTPSHHVGRGTPGRQAAPTPKAP